MMKRIASAADRLINSPRFDFFGRVWGALNDVLRDEEKKIGLDGWQFSY